LSRAARSRPRMSAAWRPVSPFLGWSFCALMFSLPLEYPDRSIPLETHTITGSLFLLVALGQPTLCFRRPTVAFWCLAAYLWAYGCISLFSEHPAEAAKLFANYLQAVLLFWVGTNLMRVHAMAEAALWSFVAGCAVIGLMNFFGIASQTVVSDLTSRQIVFGQDANRLGGNMGLGLLMLMTLVFKPHLSMVRFQTVLGTAVAFVLAKSLMLAGSRGAITAVGVGVLAYALRASDARSFSRQVGVMLLVVAALSLVIYRSDSMMKRYGRTLNEGSLSGREALYPEAWEMFRERPLLGWGPIDHNYELGLRTAGFELGEKNADGRSEVLNRDTHNLVLDVLTSVGLIGALPLFVCIAVCLISAWNARAGAAGTAPLVLSITMLALSMDTNWSASKQGWLIYAYAVASSRPLRRSAIDTRRAPVLEESAIGATR
jgi:O-antigen ligase